MARDSYRKSDAAVAHHGAVTRLNQNWVNRVWPLDRRFIQGGRMMTRMAPTAADLGSDSNAALGASVGQQGLTELGSVRNSAGQYRKLPDVITVWRGFV